MCFNSDENESKRVFVMEHDVLYSCLQMVSRGPNIIELAVLGTYFMYRILVW